MKQRLRELGVLVFLGFFVACGNPSSTTGKSTSASTYADIAKIAAAFQNQQSDLWVEACGNVENLLKDDDEGSRHQRFIVRLENSQTLLVSHNIDIAPRINDIAVGQQACFRGQYEWNDKGGVIHWTHHDPSYRQLGGWVEYEGQRFE